MNPLVVFLGLVALSRAKPFRKPGTDDPRTDASGSVTGPQAVADFERGTKGVKFSQARTNDTRTTPFPLELWQAILPKDKTSRVVTVWASTSPTSFVQYFQSPQVKRVLRRGAGPMTPAIEAQI